MWCSMNDHHSRLNSSCKHDALETINNIPGDIISDTLFNFKNYMVATSNGNNKSVKFLVECHSRVKTSTFYILSMQILNYGINISLGKSKNQCKFKTRFRKESCLIVWHLCEKELGGVKSVYENYVLGNLCKLIYIYIYIYIIYIIYIYIHNIYIYI